jgi:hypothetical protein
LFPYLDRPGYQERSLLPLESLQWLASKAPGWIERRIAFWSSWLNAQARKRYGQTYVGAALPFGQGAPPVTAAGASPPAIALVGRPTIGSLALLLRVTLAGVLGVATFQASTDGGISWIGGATPTEFTTGALVALPGTGLSAVCSAGSYGTEGVYTAPTPVAEIILGWLTTLLDLDVMRKRGTNPQDPMVTLLVDEVARVREEVQQAADGKDGLWELPATDDAANGAVNVGGVLSYSEASPFVSADRQEREGRHEDRHGSGTYGRLG